MGAPTPPPAYFRPRHAEIEPNRNRCRAELLGLFSTQHLTASDKRNSIHPPETTIPHFIPGGALTIANMVSCPVCQACAPLRCSKCHKVSYCSKDHQKDHWKAHKSECSPVTIKEDKILGRHLVATKDLKEGEIVLKEKALIVGPSQVTVPVCLGCLKVVTESNSRPCSRCGWPVCGDHCEESPLHKPECELTVARGSKVNINTFECVHPNYQCITVVRCLHQRRAAPAVWARLSALEAHCPKRRGSPQWDSDLLHVARFIRSFFKLDDFSEDEIMTVCGIVQVNGHEIPLTEPPFVAVYDRTSMVEHSCRANCSKSFTNRGEVLVAAASSISLGQNLSICYTDPLWGTPARRMHLAETKFFDCSCERCKDVTEMGTMFSALRCQKIECKGYLLPKSFISDEKKSEKPKTVGQKWFCSICDGFVTEQYTLELLHHIGIDLNAMQKGSSESCLKFLAHYGKMLHPSHYYMTDVNLALAQLIGQDNKGGLPAVKDERLALKTELCRQVANTLEKLVPAEVRARGSLLFELHAAIAETGRRRAANLGEGPAILIDFLLESKKVLEKSAKLLQNEPNELPEGKMACQAVKNLTDMNTLLTKLYASLDTSPM